MSIYIKPETTDFYEMGYNKCKEDMYSKVIPKAQAKSKAEGLSEGKAEDLTTLLKLKFGHVDKVYSSKIKTASIKELNKYLKRVFKANTIDEIFA